MISTTLGSAPSVDWTFWKEGQLRQAITSTAVRAYTCRSAYRTSASMT